MFTLIRIIPMIIVTMSMGLSASAGDTVPGHITWTLPEIVSVVTETTRRIASLSYESETLGRVADTPSGVYRRIRHNAAIQAGNRYLESIHLVPGYDWCDDLEQTRHYLYQGKLTVLLFRTRLCETTSKRASLEQNSKVRTIYNELYVDCIGWKPSDGASQPDDNTPNALPNALETLLKSQGVTIRSQSESIRDRPCVLLSSANGNDLVWLDMQRGGVVVQRHEKLEDAGMFVVISNSDFREMESGVWLPWRVTRTIHRGPAPGIMPAGERDIFATATRTIHRLEINHVQPQAFVATMPPGTIVVDLDSGRQEIAPGGEDFLDEMIRIARKTPGHRQEPAWNPARTVLLAGCLCAGVMAVWVACFRVRTRLAGERANAGDSFERHAGGN